MAKVHSRDKQQFTLGEGAAVTIREANILLAEVYEIVDGASETLGMLYERLQECHCPESVGMSSVVHLLRASLDRSTEMISQADEILGEVNSMAKEAASLLVKCQ